MNYRDLNDEIIEVIRRCCSTKEDEDDAKEYFGDTTISEMIDEALKD